MASSYTVDIVRENVTGYKDVSTVGEYALMPAATRHPVSIAIETDQSPFQSYRAFNLRRSEGDCGDSYTTFSSPPLCIVRAQFHTCFQMFISLVHLWSLSQRIYVGSRSLAKQRARTKPTDRNGMPTRTRRCSSWPAKGWVRSKRKRPSPLLF